MIDKENYRPDEIAKILDISIATVYRKLREGQIRSWKIGRCVRIRRSELARIMNTPHHESPRETTTANI